MISSRRNLKHLLMLATMCFLLLLTSCGVYSKVPAVTPGDGQWEGPLLDQADLDQVQIVLVPQERTIVLGLDEVDADLATLLAYNTQTNDQRPMLKEENTDFVLVIRNQEQ